MQVPLIKGDLGESEPFAILNVSPISAKRIGLVHNLSDIYRLCP
jgi:hypothetical protein